MTHGRITLWVEGREVLPVRAIPYVTNSPRFRPDILVQRFTRDGPFGADVFRRNWALEAYRVRGAFSSSVNPVEWDKVGKRIKRVRAAVTAAFSTTIASYAVWSIAATAALPAGWFVIYDEFVKTWQADRVDIISHEPPHDNDGLTLSPPMDAYTRSMVMEGFQWFTENEPENSVWMPPGTQQYQYRHFPGNDISIAPNNSVLARPAVPVLDEDSCILEAGLATVNVLDQNIGENNPGKTLTNESGTASAANSLKEDLAEELAALFDSVPMEVLEKMFPADGKWKGWANHAKRNGLAEARAGRALFNPYKAGIWFLGRGIANWDLARCHRKLSDNLPARSREKKYLLDGNLE